MAECQSWLLREAANNFTNRVGRPSCGWQAKCTGLSVSIGNNHNSLFMSNCTLRLTVRCSCSFYTTIKSNANNCVLIILLIYYLHILTYMWINRVMVCLAKPIVPVVLYWMANKNVYFEYCANSCIGKEYRVSRVRSEAVFLELCTATHD